MDIRREFTWNGTSWGTGAWKDYNHDGYPEVEPLNIPFTDYDEAIARGLPVGGISVIEEYTFTADYTLPTGLYLNMELPGDGSIVTINEGVTLNLPIGTVHLGFLPGTLVGVDNTSKIVIGTGVNVFYGNTNADWESGTYVWDTTTQAWVAE
jgi:hypothetical protein